MKYIVLLCDGMADLPREDLPGKTFKAVFYVYAVNTVFSVPQNGVADIRHMRPYLMSAPGENRIDRNTSGIVIAAKNAEALRILNCGCRGRGRKHAHSAEHTPLFYKGTFLSVL